MVEWNRQHLLHLEKLLCTLYAKITSQPRLDDHQELRAVGGTQPDSRVKP